MTTSQQQSTNFLWMISAPSKSSPETLSSLRERLVKHEYADIFPFSIPDFKVGTLDSLMILSDELSKMDGIVESCVTKISDSLRNLLNGEVEEWKGALLVGDSKSFTYKQHLCCLGWKAIKILLWLSSSRLVYGLGSQAHDPTTLPI